MSRRLRWDYSPTKTPRRMAAITGPTMSSWLEDPWTSRTEKSLSPESIPRRFGTETSRPNIISKRFWEKTGTRSWACAVRPGHFRYSSSFMEPHIIARPRSRLPGVLWDAWWASVCPSSRVWEQCLSTLPTGATSRDAPLAGRPTTAWGRPLPFCWPESAFGRWKNGRGNPYWTTWTKTEAGRRKSPSPRKTSTTESTKTRKKHASTAGNPGLWRWKNPQKTLMGTKKILPRLRFLIRLIIPEDRDPIGMPTSQIHPW
mmetsp:Transcript_20764/g.51506  ORF Transcript_20764/g.51506 Transcript_20764/m.51506 type:complete len:258 (+) Transcript_20764:567-1340(+)